MNIRRIINELKRRVIADVPSHEHIECLLCGGVYEPEHYKYNSPEFWFSPVKHKESCPLHED